MTDHLKSAGYKNVNTTTPKSGHTMTPPSTQGKKPQPIPTPPMVSKSKLC